MNPRQAKADARVEAAAEWLFKRRFRDRPWPPKFEPIADEWRREARELLAHIDAAQETEVERMRRALREIEDLPMGPADAPISRAQTIARAALDGSEAEDV